MECLESVFMQEPPPEYEVIVIDNASSDESLELIKSRFPQITLIANEKNTGFSRANNKAIRLSSSPYILLLNNDASLREKDFLKKALSFMERNKDAAALGPEILSSGGKVQNPYYISYPNTATEFLSISGLLPVYNRFMPGRYFYTREGLARYAKDKGGINVSHLCGACMFLRRHAVEEAGLFDEDMFFYREDLDLCYRLKKKGWKIFVLPSITAVHTGAISSKKAPFSVTAEAAKSLYIFFKKNYGIREYFYIRLVHFAAAFLRMLIHPLLRIMKRSSPGAGAFYREIFKRGLIGIR